MRWLQLFVLALAVSVADGSLRGWGWLHAAREEWWVIPSVILVVCGVLGWYYRVKLVARVMSFWSTWWWTRGFFLGLLPGLLLWVVLTGIAVGEWDWSPGRV